LKAINLGISKPDASSCASLLRQQTPADDVKKKELQDKFKDISEKFEMDWQLFDMSLNTPAIIMVSKFDHCLVDLLYRCSIGTLNMDIAAVISNHDTARELVDREGIPFHHIPVTSRHQTGC
jgi:formyltetrahydrofolate deformylase